MGSSQSQSSIPPRDHDVTRPEVTGFQLLVTGRTRPSLGNPSGTLGNRSGRNRKGTKKTVIMVVRDDIVK